MFFFLLVLLAAFNYVFAANYLGSKSVIALSDFLRVCFAAFAVYSCALAYSNLSGEEGEKTVWLLLALGLGSWFLAELLWLVQEVFLGILVPFPSISDFFWLLGYPFMVASLLLHTNHVVHESRLSQMQFLQLFTLVVVVLVLSIGMPSVFSIDSKDLQKTLNLVYTAGDFMLFLSSVLIAFVWAGEDLRFRAKDLSRAWLLIAVGFALIAVYDVLFAYLLFGGAYSSGSPVNFVYEMGYGTIGLGALLYAFPASPQ